MTSARPRWDRELADPRRRGLQAIPGWVPELPEPTPDHLCQLCQLELDRYADDGLCSECSRLVQLQDEEDAERAWLDAGGRTCRRCHARVMAAGTSDGRCPCGGQLL